MIRTQKHNVMLLCIVGLFNFNSNAVIAEKYAIIYSGGEAATDSDPGNSEFWYDAFDMYRTLIQDQGYSHSNIYFFYGIGSDFSSSVDRYKPSTYGWSSIVDFDNKRSTITTQFGNIGNTVTTDDNLVIFVTSHGVRRSPYSA